MLLKCDTLIHSNIKLRCEQHCNATWINLNSIQFNQFNLTIGMQIGEEGIQILVNMVLEKKTFKWHKCRKTPFHASLIRNGLNKL